MRSRAAVWQFSPFWGVFAIGACSGVASLLMYRSNGYSRSMLLVWLIGLLGLSVFFWSRSRFLPQISTADLLAPLGLVLAFGPLYLLGLFRWPVQVSGDEVAIIYVAKDYAHPPAGFDPFGPSNYFSRPTLLFLGWGKLGELFGFDLFHMRLLHAVCGLATIAASYVLMRQLLPRGWAIFAACIFGVSHAFLMISRLAMRENTAVLVEVVALSLLLWGLRRRPCARDVPGRVRRRPRASTCTSRLGRPAALARVSRRSAACSSRRIPGAQAPRRSGRSRSPASSSWRRRS